MRRAVCARPAFNTRFAAARARAAAPATPVAMRVSLRKDGTLKGHQSRVFDLRWSPTHPARVASVGEAGAHIWDVGGAVRRKVSFPGTELMRVCWHPDGEHVLTGSAQGKIVVHAADDGHAIATLDASTEDEVYGVEVLSSEGLLAAGAGDTVQLWDLQRATKMCQVKLPALTGGVNFGGEHRNPDGAAYLFCLAARGRILSAALSDGTVRLLDSETLQTLQVLGEHPNPDPNPRPYANPNPNPTPNRKPNPYPSPNLSP